ncbi:uncharacterized protein [Blastocystis hominis]|uniref:UBC core domain-containing protein n=1 Tax=Blastocystis hominis TaxID=12968 RepID=D8LYH6_BLAHO|nr:uncharacterized protein [Blastocystis hominis]CBK20631.2 unnamed protein product [Blastocystis hominis]|eukprot:XP_012894679.1 uncharacterized protein [Blastocystis hominis]
MSTKARKRILRDYKDYLRNKPMGITCRIHEDNMMIWDACILGPPDTPWEGGTFFLRIELSEEYPDVAPSIRFLNRLFHPNIYVDGKICLDILQNRWTPQYTILTVLLSIQSLLNDPNPASPANQHASSIYCHSKETFWIFVYLIGSYNEMVRECVVRSWLSPAAVKECFSEEGRFVSFVPCFEDCLSQNTIHPNLLEVLIT